MKVEVAPQDPAEVLEEAGLVGEHLGPPVQWVGIEALQGTPPPPTPLAHTVPPPHLPPPTGSQWGEQGLSGRPPPPPRGGQGGPASGGQKGHWTEKGRWLTPPLPLTPSEIPAPSGGRQRGYQGRERTKGLKEDPGWGPSA